MSHGAWVIGLIVGMMFRYGEPVGLFQSEHRVVIKLELIGIHLVEFNGIREQRFFGFVIFYDDVLADDKGV